MCQSLNTGVVHLYHKVEGQWERTQSLNPPAHVLGYGESMKMNSNGLVVMARNGEGTHIFVYKFHPTTGKWIPDGTIPTRSQYSGDVDIENDQLAVIVNGRTKNTVVTAVYRKREDDDN